MQAGLIYGPQFHYLDHLAPLCSLLEIPLIITDGEIAALAKKFYPELNIQNWHLLETPERLVKEYDAIFCCTPRALFEEAFYFAEAMQNKRVRTIWVPHGNSDKGRLSRFMEGLKEEELILTYGKRMEEFLNEKGVHSSTYCIGNYRLAYYKKHQAFYDELVGWDKTTLLYAPTWQDREKNSSFPELWPFLLDAPEEFHLIVKLHPNLYEQMREIIDELKEKAPKNLEILEDFPPIYPLLANVDLYIGDMSSIGYDFLSFQKPMILLKNSELLRAGRFLPRNRFGELFEEVRIALKEGAPNHALYEETFSDVKPLYNLV